MEQLSRASLDNIAQLAAIELNDQEAAYFEQQITKMLVYVNEVTTLVIDKEYPPVVNYNVFREDIAAPYNRQEILAAAPKTEDNYIVVPSIITDK